MPLLLTQVAVAAVAKAELMARAVLEEVEMALPLGMARMEQQIEAVAVVVLVMAAPLWAALAVQAL